MPAEWTLAALTERARRLATSGRRHILGITGPPGAGKSTLSADITARLAGLAVCVPMDGFHRTNEELRRLGLADRKGAPETFDADGYIALLERLRDATEEVTYAPAFRRDLDESVPHAIAVPRHVPLVVTEGNYLLVDDGPWARVRPLLAECWYLRSDADRVDRLIGRHLEFGKSEAAARDWVLRSDEANAAIISPTERYADLVIVGHPR